MPTINRNAAYLRRLGLEHLQVTDEHLRTSPAITPSLRMITKTMKHVGQPAVTTRVISATRYSTPYGMGANICVSWPKYLQLTNDPDAIAVLKARAEMPVSYRTHVPIEAYCLAANVSPLRILELITAACVRIGATASSIIAAVNHPRVVEKTVEMALTDAGFDDRKVLHQATGFLPSAKGPSQTVHVHANATASAQAASVASPPPESTIRRMVDRFNDARSAQPMLPPTSAVSVPTIDVRELEAVEVSDASDEDD